MRRAFGRHREHGLDVLDPRHVEVVPAHQRRGALGRGRDRLPLAALEQAVADPHAARVVEPRERRAAARPRPSRRRRGARRSQRRDPALGGRVVDVVRLRRRSRGARSANASSGAPAASSSSVASSCRPSSASSRPWASRSARTFSAGRRSSRATRYSWKRGWQRIASWPGIHANGRCAVRSDASRSPRVGAAERRGAHRADFVQDRRLDQEVPVRRGTARRGSARTGSRAAGRPRRPCRGRARPSARPRTARR